MLREAVLRDCRSGFRIGARQLAACAGADAVVTILMELLDLIPENLGEHPSWGLVYTQPTPEPARVGLPPVPAFYHRPKTIMDIVHQTVGRALDQFGIEHDLFERWKGV